MEVTATSRHRPQPAEHSVVLVRGGARVKDFLVKYHIIRGTLDAAACATASRVAAKYGREGQPEAGE